MPRPLEASAIWCTSRARTRSCPAVQSGDDSCMLQGALADCDQAIALRPEEAILWYQRGWAQYHLGNFTVSAYIVRLVAERSISCSAIKHLPPLPGACASIRSITCSQNALMAVKRCCVQLPQGVYYVDATRVPASGGGLCSQVHLAG